MFPGQASAAAQKPNLKRSHSNSESSNELAYSPPHAGRSVDGDDSSPALSAFSRLSLRDLHECLQHNMSSIFGSSPPSGTESRAIKRTFDSVCVLVDGSVSSASSATTSQLDVSTEEREYNESDDDQGYEYEGDEVTPEDRQPDRFLVEDTASLLRSLTEVVTSVVDILHISEPLAHRLLKEYRWDKDTLLEAYTADSEQVLLIYNV